MSIRCRDMVSMVVFLAVAAAVSVSICQAGELQGLVCDTNIVTKATGFFRVEQDNAGTWRFVTPGGHGFFLAGNNGPSRMAGDYCPARGYSLFTRTLEGRYGKDSRKWAHDSSRRLLSWGFNTVNTWDCPMAGLVGTGLAHTRVVQLGASFSGVDANGETRLAVRFPNVFHPDFAEHCRRMAVEVCGGERDNPWIVGWYTDNELSWRGSAAADGCIETGLYDAVAKLPHSHMGRQSLDRFLSDRGLSVSNDVPMAVRADFVRLIASEYYRIATSAIRSAAPNHLVLGCRFAGFMSTPSIAWEEGGKWNDVMSVNMYPPADLKDGVVWEGFRKGRRPIQMRIRDSYALARRPIVITEWSYPALDTECPCKVGAGQRVATQRERAESSALFVKTMLSIPEIVGYVHFRWVDQPPMGRWKMSGGEDCNYGLVNELDEPYAPLTQMFGDVQGRMYEIRRQSCR